MKHLRKLARIGGDALAAEPPNVARIQKTFGIPAASLLLPLLNLKNGFYAFERALHVFPEVSAGAERGLIEWNDSELWRGHYRGMTDGAVCFAEDVFGTQFCVREHAIYTFDPETGAFECMAGSVDEWAAKILEDPQFWTGYPVARAWQVSYGAIPPGSRLVPGQPFVLGGDFTVENVAPIEAVEAMRSRAHVALQIRDLPDGTTIALRVVD